MVLIMSFRYQHPKLKPNSQTPLLPASVYHSL